MRKQQERDEKLTEIESFNATYIIFQSNVAQYLSYNKTRTKELNDKVSNDQTTMGTLYR